MSSAQATAPPVVLVVDDEPIVLRILARQLEGHGYDVRTAADGPSALALLEALGRPVDLLLTDVRMPQLTGDALARMALARGSARRVLFVSGFGEHQAEVEQIGPVLMKPFSEAQLHEAVEHQLHHPAC